MLRPSSVRIRNPFGCAPKTSCGGPFSGITCHETSFHVPTRSSLSAPNTGVEIATKVCAWLTSSLPKHAYLTARLGDNPKRVLSKVPVCHLRPIRMNNGPTGNHRNASVSFLCADHSPAVHPRRNEPFASTRDRKSVV